MILTEIQAKLAISALAVMTALAAGLGAWALLERAGRLECKADLVAARAQVAVLADAVKRQNAALEDLGKQTAGVIDRTGRILVELEQQAAGDRKTIAGLRSQLSAKVPTGADGKPKDCEDYLKEWRAEP